MRPYIGMTDVPSPEWLSARLNAFQEAGGGMLPHQLHSGVMMSFKSLNGIRTKWAAVWPKNAEIEKIFVRHADVLNVLHYADYDGHTGLDDLRHAVMYGGPRLDGLQLDMPWPSPKLVAALKKAHPEVRIILQVGRRALDQVSDDPKRLPERLEKYQDAIDDVLLDKSGGEGRGLDAAVLRPFVEAVRKRMPRLGVTLAGGLGPDTLHLVAPLVRDFPALAIDAQGRLRASGSAMDPIDAGRADIYLRGAIEMFLGVVPSGAPI
ncbi:MAG: hypothetical protein AAB554_03240 [Patescibacteria group bacterium]